MYLWTKVWDMVSQGDVGAVAIRSGDLIVVFTQDTHPHYETNSLRGWNNEEMAKEHKRKMV